MASETQLHFQSLCQDAKANMILPVKCFFIETKSFLVTRYMGQELSSTKQLTNFGKSSSRIRTEWMQKAFLEHGSWLFVTCHSNRTNSQQLFAKYCLCETQLNSLFSSLYREQLVLHHLSVSLSRPLIRFHCLSVQFYGW